jgi:hypothetical protein
MAAVVSLLSMHKSTKYKTQLEILLNKTSSPGATCLRSDHGSTAKKEKRKRNRRKSHLARSLGTFATLVGYKPCDGEKKIIGPFHLNISQPHHLIPRESRIEQSQTPFSQPCPVMHASPMKLI